jgi:hypothetical protein
MGESELENDKGNDIFKTHKEILELIEEIKEFEKEYNITDIESEFIEVPDKLVEFLEVDSEEFKEVEETSKRRFKIKYQTRARIRKLREEQKKFDPTTFRIRFDDKGDLVNIDVKKAVTKPKKRKIKSDQKGDLESEEHVEIEEEEEKKSRFGKILSILRKSIPKREKQPEEEEEEEF